MSCVLCEMKESRLQFLITSCVSCDEKYGGIHPIIISFEHRPEFTDEEKKFIQAIFLNRNIRWERRSIPNHAHAHIE